jgi:hypothetical protein
MSHIETLRAQGGESEHGHFYIKDSIGVPHPYCITPKHVAEASDHHCGMLNEAAIEAAERKGATCGICRGKLSYRQHEQAVLIGCRAALKDEGGKVNPELHQYLLKLKPLVEDGKHFAGFAFADETAHDTAE